MGWMRVERMDTMDGHVHHAREIGDWLAFDAT
jgi:hypothetical protein